MKNEKWNRWNILFFEKKKKKKLKKKKDNMKYSEKKKYSQTPLTTNNGLWLDSKQNPECIGDKHQWRELTNFCEDKLQYSSIEIVLYVVGVK